ncbi:hypothetical protein Taro_053157 [Colocasia esculenta]|uniref:Uncharacterized protein n=1 Tax=Colocasia esculenta TaxID=4460 RepID=A0A843XLS5_COLES|nr:hypothetical protein [Colocasia esculenta]
MSATCHALGGLANVDSGKATASYVVFLVLASFSAWSRREDVARSRRNVGSWSFFAFFAKVRKSRRLLAPLLVRSRTVAELAVAHHRHGAHPIPSPTYLKPGVSATSAFPINPAMDSTLKDGPSPLLIFEESADSELCASDAAMLSSGAEEEEEEDDDDDAESCNCEAYGSAHRGFDSYVDDGSGRSGGEEDAGEDGPPVSWWAWLAQNAACGTEEAGRGEEEEVGSVKPVAGMEDRLFWETCLAYGNKPYHSSRGRGLDLCKMRVVRGRCALEATYTCSSYQVFILEANEMPSTFPQRLSCWVLDSEVGEMPFNIFPKGGLSTLNLEAIEMPLTFSYRVSYRVLSPQVGEVPFNISS